MKTAKGQITLVKISDVITYELLPSVTQIIVSSDGIISTPTIMCTAYKVEGTVRTELSALEGTIKYKSSSSQAYLNYDSTNGVTVNARWSFITFFLFLAGETDPIIRVDVPITRNGQVDTNFRVWVGSLPNPNTPNFLRPWIGEENEPQTDEMHVNDYYIAPNMQYYCFIQNQINEEYVWEPVTDRILQEWLSRANESTTGFIVDYSQSQGLSDINTIVSTYFGSRNYVIGDLWSGAKYTTTVNGQLQLLYDDEPLLCIRSKFGSFSINDWKPISNTSLNNKLRDVGIDLDEHRVIITSDETWFVNTVGELPKAIFNFDEEDGWSISTDLVKIKGDVEIDGSLIVGALEHQNLITGDYEIIPELANLLAANNISQVIHNQDGTISSTINGNTYTWETTDTLNSADFVKFNVSNGTGNRSFTLNKDGLLQADNAVIRGLICASEGYLQGAFLSANGKFLVDGLGNVTATSFTGRGVFVDGEVTITQDNFYDYFLLAKIDVESLGNDQFFGKPFNKRWIPAIKQIPKNIVISSVPQNAMTYDSSLEKYVLTIIFPHYIRKENNGSEMISCRRGDVLYTELLQFSEDVYTIRNFADILLQVATSLFVPQQGTNQNKIIQDKDFTESIVLKYTLYHNEQIDLDVCNGILPVNVSDVGRGLCANWFDIDPELQVSIQEGGDPNIINTPENVVGCDIIFRKRQQTTAQYNGSTVTRFLFDWESQSFLPGDIFNNIGNLAHTFIDSQWDNSGISMSISAVEFSFVNIQINSNDLQEGSSAAHPNGLLKRQGTVICDCNKLINRVIDFLGSSKPIQYDNNTEFELFFY